MKKPREREWSRFFEGELIPKATQGHSYIEYESSDDFLYFEKWSTDEVDAWAGAHGITYEETQTYGETTINFSWGEKIRTSAFKSDAISKNVMHTAEKLRKVMEQSRKQEWLRFFKDRLALQAEEGNSFVEYTDSDDFPYFDGWSDNDINERARRGGIAYEVTYSAHGGYTFSFDWGEASSQ